MHEDELVAEYGQAEVAAVKMNDRLAELQIVRDEGSAALPVHAMLSADLPTLRARAEAL
ncbi:MAG: hypothetical protein HW396_55, partial [Candidatus Dadabacteria bacterium]|nr:hypothetical protein [Candidatus Dadabacteria bacterium]